MSLGALTPRTKVSDYLSYSEFELLDFLIALQKSRPEFYEYSACNKEDMNLFFPGQGQSAVMKEAIEICFTCPVQKECHEYALENKIDHGVWGGSSADQRRFWIKENTSIVNAWEELLLKQEEF